MALRGDLGSLDALARDLEGRGDAARTLPGRAAEAIAAVAAAQLGAGVTPYGEPWPARQDGGRAIAGAASHVQIQARGMDVVATLDAIGEHQNRRRQMIPSEGRGLPPSWAAELERVAAETLEGGR